MMAGKTQKRSGSGKPAAKSSGSKRTTSKKSTTTHKSVVTVDKDSSVRVEQIDNGFLLIESGTTGKGKNREWYEKKLFSATNPVSIAKPTLRFGGKKKVINGQST